jgi:hypothetical protein
MKRARALRLIALLSLAAAPGCGREAPGPEECALFAQAAAGASRDSPFLTPELLATIDSATRECLTEPYDRELLKCVLVTRQTRACLDGFRRRKERRQ